MEHSTSWEANSFSVSQVIPHIVCGPKVHTTFTKTHPLSPSSSKGSNQVRGLVNDTKHCTVSWWEVVSTLPDPKAGGPPLSSCPLLLIQCIHSYPPYLKAAHLSTNWGQHHAAVTATDLSWIKCIERGHITNFAQQSFKHQKLCYQQNMNSAFRKLLCT
jgi:hypothetical protein